MNEIFRRNLTMNDFVWNHAEIKPPSINTYRVPDKIIDLKKFATIVSEAIHIFSNQTKLQVESQYLSRIIYRMRRKFRHDIGFRSSRKTKSALNKYLQTDFIMDLTHFIKCIPEEYDPQATYLPTRQMLQYVLIRLQTFSKLLARILTCSKIASTFYNERINRGQSWNVSLLALAIHSRIWSISKELIIQVISCYNNLLCYEFKLQVNGPEWLPKEHVFPKNLQIWLNIDLQGTIPVIQENDVAETFIDITEDDDVEFCFSYDESCQIISTENSNERDPNKSANQRLPKITCETTCVDLPHIDVGESISRENLKNVDGSIRMRTIPKKTNLRTMNNMRDQKLNKKVSGNHNLDDIKDAKDLINFLRQEEEYRITNKKRAISANLGIVQWHAFKNRMRTFIKKLNAKNKNPSSNNKKLLENIKKEWKLACN